MPTGGTIQLARILGIRIGVSTSWFVVLFLFIYILSGYFQDVLDGSNTTAYVVAVASALCFFGSLILHELGHAVAARRLGIEISGIDLWFFGGIAKMSRDTDSPSAEFKVAIAGPLVTLAIIVLCVGVGALVSGLDHFVDVALLEAGTTGSPGLVLLSWLATINTAVLIFNLVPAFPLDGGRVARAAAWKLTGSRGRATRISAGLGSGFAYLMIAFGIFLLADDAVGSGLWMIVLGFILRQAARGAVIQTAMSERLEGVTVADIMDREPLAISPETTALQARDEHFAQHGRPFFPVVAADGTFVGLLREEAVEEAIAAGRPALPVSEVLDADASQWSVDEDQTLETLLESERLRSLGALAAVDDDGLLQGIVTFEDVRRALTPLAGRLQ
jgi:Zn-dependent protease